MRDKFSIIIDKCNIREVKLSDDKQILDAMNCPEVASMHSGGFRGIPDVHSYIDILTKEYDEGKLRTLAIAERQSDMLLGCIVVDIHKYFPRAELGYWIEIPHRNKGYMTEAISAIIKYGFSKMGLIRIQAHHSINNPASGRVLEKAGMICEGIMRLYNGCSDERMYAIINTDKLLN